MFQRVLWISLVQVLRSIALVLLPTSFIALLAWATAGSGSGNTADPIRGVIWLWLGTHHTPFHLLLPPAGQSGYLTYLPMGALVFPFFAIRSSFMRLIDQIDIGGRALALGRTLFAILYASFATLLAWGSRTESVMVIIYFVPLICIPGVLLVTTTVHPRSRRRPSDSFHPARRILALLFGLSSLVLGVTFFMNLNAVKNLTLVLEPGYLGAILLMALNIVYVPNALIATFSYLVGTGFAVGANTLVSPWTHSLLEIPSIPILGALPPDRNPFMLLTVLIFIFAGGLLYAWTSSQSIKILLRNYCACVASVAILAFLASGSLLTPAMGAIGVSTWQVTLAFALELGLGIALAALVPPLAGRIRMALRR